MGVDLLSGHTVKTEYALDAHMTSGTSYERHVYIQFKSCAHRVKVRSIRQFVDSFAANR